MVGGKEFCWIGTSHNPSREVPSSGQVSKYLTNAQYHSDLEPSNCAIDEAHRVSANAGAPLGIQLMRPFGLVWLLDLLNRKPRRLTSFGGRGLGYRHCSLRFRRSLTWPTLAIVLRL